MSLTVGQASDVNTLLRYVLGISRPGSGVPGSDEALQAAERLAAAADKRLMAGIRAQDVTATWASLELPGRTGAGDAR